MNCLTLAIQRGRVGRKSIQASTHCTNNSGISEYMFQSKLSMGNEN